MASRTPLRHAARLLRQPLSKPVTRSLRPSTLTPRAVTQCQPLRAFSGQTRVRAGIMPESEDPAPPEREAHQELKEPTPLSDEEFHEQADRYLEVVVGKMEEVGEGREDVDVEYSAGVLSITYPPNGTYVLNKQPPNKQVWLSSPITGPKRFDWVVAGEAMEMKQGSGVGDWIYLRDGTSLTELLRKELGISVLFDDHEGTP